MIKIQNIPFYLLIGLLLILMKLFYSQATTYELIFLIGPTDWLVSIALGSPSFFLEEEGFFHSDLDFIIDKSCSGFNFLIICYGMISFLFLGFFENKFLRILSMPFLWIASFLLTLVANASRILFSVFLQKVQVVFWDSPIDWLHQAEGVLTYLSFLILFYALANYLFHLYTPKHA